MEDPREQFGRPVERKVYGRWHLVPSRHGTPETGGLLDYGLACYLPNGQQVVIGELFAAAIGASTHDPVRIDTARIGEAMVTVLNAHWLTMTTEEHWPKAKDSGNA